MVKLLVTDLNSGSAHSGILIFNEKVQIKIFDEIEDFVKLCHSGLTMGEVVFLFHCHFVPFVHEKNTQNTT